MRPKTLNLGTCRLNKIIKTKKTLSLEESFLLLNSNKKQKLISLKTSIDIFLQRLYVVPGFHHPYPNSLFYPLHRVLPTERQIWMSQSQKTLGQASIKKTKAGQQQTTAVDVEIVN